MHAASVWYSSRTFPFIQLLSSSSLQYEHIISYYKIKIHSICEIEDFVETHLCKPCDTPIARITGCVSSLRI